MTIKERESIRRRLYARRDQIASELVNDQSLRGFVVGYLMELNRTRSQLERERDQICSALYELDQQEKRTR